MNWSTTRNNTKMVQLICNREPKYSKRKMLLGVAAVCDTINTDDLDIVVQFREAVEQLRKKADGEEFSHALINIYFHPDWDNETLLTWACKESDKAEKIRISDALRLVFDDPTNEYRWPVECRISEEAKQLAWAVYNGDHEAGKLLADELEICGFPAQEEMIRQAAKLLDGCFCDDYGQSECAKCVSNRKWFNRLNSEQFGHRKHLPEMLRNLQRSVKGWWPIDIILGLE